MSKISFARSRRAALLGLILQFLTFATLIIVAYAVRDPNPADPNVTNPFNHIPSLFHLAWFALAGVPMWLTAVLIFRQRELEEVEHLELEQLKRERAAGGGSEAIFEDEAGGFRVAHNRLVWMQRFLIPVFSLLVSATLIGGGAWLVWQTFNAGLGLTTTPEAIDAWGAYQHLAIAMIVLAITLILNFLLSRYASGMARTEGWQLLRGCGSYMFTTAILIAILIIGLGVKLYAANLYVDRLLAFAIPFAMLILGTEVFLNFILDLYRPRTAGVEPRAAFDSRLLGLFAEPGGIAHSIAEAVNYQFGFEVSKTWFFQLMTRAALPLVAVGLATLWAMTAMVIVAPYQHVVIERFGAQVNPDNPHGPGFHWKFPWPIDKAVVYNTGEVHEMFIGFEQFAADPEQFGGEIDAVILWTQEKHFNMEHHDFLIPLTPKEALLPAAATVVSEDDLAPYLDATFADGTAAVPVNLVRLTFFIHYRIDPQRLDEYTRAASDPGEVLRRVAWHAATRINGHSDLQYLLSDGQRDIGDQLRAHLQEASARLQLGLDIGFVGVLNIHPETSVAEAHRAVVNAEQEMIASIREARVEQTSTLTKVAGGRARALHLAHAIEVSGEQELRYNNAQRVLEETAAEAAAIARFRERLLEFAPLFQALERAQWETYRTRQRAETVQEGVRLGLQYTEADRRAASEELLTEERAAAAAQKSLREAVEPVLTEARDALRPEVADALYALVQAELARDLWNRELLRLESELRGEAAALLSQAQAARWEIEMSAAADLIRVLAEQEAFRLAPKAYMTRLYAGALAEGMQDALKYFLAFDPSGRTIHVRYQAEETVRPSFNPGRTNR